MTARHILLAYFFTVIGINAHVSDLVRGGKPLGVLLAVTVAFMLAENLAGISVARLLGLDPAVGLLAASISITRRWYPPASSASGLAPRRPQWPT
jgi:ESS family glutamate:Na+ symporter